MPTYRRPGSLATALEALLGLDPPEGGYEIVVVDDGSPDRDEVTDVLQAAAASAPVPLRWDALERNRGPAAARNVAWRMANGEWIAFTDDDCRPAKDWIVRLLDKADAGRADVVQGCTVPDPDRAHLLAQPFTRTMQVDGLNGFYPTCNIAYRRSLVELLGGLDEQFRLIGDDTDLGWRAEEAGARIVFAADAVVVHDVVLGSWRSDLRSRRRWADGVRMVAKHPDARRRLMWKPYVYRRSHAPLLALAAGFPLVASRRGRCLWLAAVAALVAADVSGAGSAGAAKARLQRRVSEAYEIAWMLRRSVAERALLL